ncbi:MAG: hypothetical protein ACI92I_000687 [Acidimicrobiales bacterium]|jgi:hypothetical protein
MNDTQLQQPTYSSTQITKAVIVSALVAVSVLVLFIMPAEYGKDPTGIGGLLGLTNLAKESSVSTQSFIPSPLAYQTLEEEITLQAGEDVEYKIMVERSSQFLFAWNATSPLFYDFHAEPTEEEGKKFLPFKSYDVDTTDAGNGSLLAEFTGTHGWYWRNETSQSVTLTLNVAGYYEQR